MPINLFILKTNYLYHDESKCCILAEKSLKRIEIKLMGLKRMQTQKRTMMFTLLLLPRLPFATFMHSKL